MSLTVHRQVPSVSPVRIELGAINKEISRAGYDVTGKHDGGQLPNEGSKANIPAVLLFLPRRKCSDHDCNNLAISPFHYLSGSHASDIKAKKWKCIREKVCRGVGRREMIPLE